ncbi:MAG: EAL domain-containing protein [Steroidobacteraceae bacterium]
MGSTRLLNGGLGSRFALRTYLLFCLCTLVPVGMFGVIGYHVVSAELRDHADERLAEASKHYGLLLNERLIQAETALVELVRAHNTPKSIGEVTVNGDTRLGAVKMQYIPLSDTDLDVAVPGSFTVTPTLHVSDGAAPVVVMQIIVQSGKQKIVASAQLLPADLWDADAVTLAGMKLCASVAGRRLTCTSPDQGLIDPKIKDEVLRQQWTLFLKPRYAADEWTIEASQPASSALQGLRTFQITLLGAAALACFAALLLSAIQIRRSHRPLAELIDAVRHMAASRFDTRVKLKGRGEFAQLGRAFNQLAADLQREFRILRAFSRIDRQILANSAVEPVIRAVLPRVSRLLRAQSIMLAVQEPDGPGSRVYLCTPGQIPLVGVQSVQGNPLPAMLERPGAGWLLHSLQPAAQDLHWSSTSIVVGGTLRGVIAVGRVNGPGQRQKKSRHLQGLARRFAVALANEDRERALMRQAYYDSLTSLPNRQLFKDRLTQEILRSRREGARVVLFFIDLDHFKNVNDSLGHSAGDELLRAASTRLQGLLRPGDTLARLGGDEFTLVAPGLDDLAAETMARRMIDSVSQPFQLGGMQCVVQASVGIAVFPRDSDTGEALLRSADTAMYRAKSQGRGRAVFFEETMNARAVRRLALEQRLRLAIGNRTLTLDYQPKFATEDRGLVGVEALARWEDEIHGHVPPSEFIPLAEESGLIEPLGLWCLREACAAMRSWRNRGLQIGHVAVNVSMQQLRNQSFADLVKATLLEHDLVPADLEIEITESMLAGDTREVGALLAAIRNLGVRVAIDDFGTGYSSMVALQQLPADVVKIDRTFVVGCQHPQGLALLKALIAAGHALGKEVVAEGVETEEQLAILRACHCDVIQGFLLGMPQSAEELERGFQGAESVDAVVVMA